MTPLIQFPGPWSALVTLPLPPNRETVLRILALEQRVLDATPEVTTIPAFNRLLVTGDAAHWDPDAVGRHLGDMAELELSRPQPSLPALEEVVLPACYHPELAPDLEDLARVSGLSNSEVGRIHAEREYTVLATGFAPGFAYLGDVDPRIACERRPAPRRQVAAGSIGIADQRTGVYPSKGPGGWQLIGRVPAALFEDAGGRLRRFSPGQTVRFGAISLADYRREA